MAEHLAGMKAWLRRTWRPVYKSVSDALSRFTPEFVKNIKAHVIYWREKSTIRQNQPLLREILNREQAGGVERQIVVFPPSLDWNVQLFQRPQQLALALAKQGALVFYIQPKPDHQQPAFSAFRERLYLCPVHIKTFEIIHKPLVYLLTWNSKFATQLPHPRILYDYVDNIKAFYGDQRKIRQGHQALLQWADYVLATAHELYEEVKRSRPDVIFSPNGVDYAHFSRAARREYASPPGDMQVITAKAQPVIGYYGALARWFDFDLLKRLAVMRPGYQFVLIGPDFDGTVKLAGIGEFGNISWLGVKHYEELPAYLQYFDVATIPFIVNDITHATSPLKLFEYMAGEKPIVITPMRESMHYPGVRVGKDADEFAHQLDVALEKTEDQGVHDLLRQTALENTWERRAQEILDMAGKANREVREFDVASH